MQSAITFEDVIASYDKFGCVLEADTKVRDLKKLNPKSLYDTTYIPLLFKHVNGKKMKVKILFKEQILASGAKIPQGAESENADAPKNMNISFNELSKDTIQGGDYVPKEKDSEEAQKTENKRIDDNIDRYMKNNTLFLRVLEIIDESYKTVCANLIAIEAADPKKLGYKLKKDRKQTDTIIYSIKQVSRVDKETDTEEKLEHPIYRLKIPIYKEDGRVGVWSKYHSKFIYTIFDARKMTKKNNFQPVNAKIIKKGKSEDLTYSDAGDFITYKSLVGGAVVFDTIVSSKFGLSLSNSLYEMYVYRHKAKASAATMSVASIIALRGGNEDENESDSDVVEEKRANNSDEDEDEDEDDGEDGNSDEDADETQEPHDSDEEPEEQEEKVSKKKPTLKSGKRGKKTEE
jgi:hypothetical protein